MILERAATLGPLSLEAAYQHARDSPISVNDKEECVIGKAVEDTNPVCDVSDSAGSTLGPLSLEAHVRDSPSL